MILSLVGLDQPIFKQTSYQGVIVGERLEFLDRKSVV